MRKRKTGIVLMMLLIMATVSGCQSPNSAADGNQQQNSGEKQGNITAANPAGLTEFISGTYSAKEFIEKQVEDELIQQILETGAKSPSARNLQPWHFTVVKEFDMVREFASHAAEGSVAIIVSGLTEEQPGVNAAFDCALATQTMYLTAQSLGLGAHLYTGPVSNINDQYRESLGIPDGYQAEIVLCVGYVDPEIDTASSASPRNSLSDMVNYVE